MNLSRYDFNLPSQLIADRPRKPRGTSRLLVVDKESGTITATTFDNIFDYFSEKDYLELEKFVIKNKSKIISYKKAFDLESDFISDKILRFFIRKTLQIKRAII